MFNQLQFSSTGAPHMRHDLPNTSDALTAKHSSANDSSNSADAARHAALLEKFPASLHDEIKRTLPGHEQLAAFHQGFIERECPLTEKSVAHELNAVRDHRIALQEQHRIHHVTDFQRDYQQKSHDLYGATQLHHAILNEDIGLARALLSKSGVDHGAIIQPRMRLKDWTSIGYAVSGMPPSVEKEEVHNAILGALQRRGTPGVKKEPVTAASQDSAHTSNNSSNNSSNNASDQPGDHQHPTVKKRPNPPGDRTAVAFASHNGDNPLTFALTRDASQPMIELLLGHYATHAPAMLSAADANGVTPLIAAVGSGREAIVRLLLKQPGVDINGVNRQGQSAVMTSITAGNSKMLDLLLGYGPDLDMRDARGRTAGVVAMNCDASDLFTKLAQAQLQSAKTPNEQARIHAEIVRDFRTAALAGKLSLVKAMLASCGAALDAKTIASALGDAVRIPGNASVVACLIDDSQTRVALNEVASRGLEQEAADAEIFDLVARALYPAVPTGVNPGKLKALMHGAAKLGLTDWVVYGLDGGIDIDDYDLSYHSVEGSSVLMKSLTQGHEALTIELLSRKASLLNPEGGFENSALAIAGLHLPSAAQTQKNMSLIITHHPDLYSERATAICLTRIAVSRNLPMLIDKVIADSQLPPEAFDDDPQSLLMQVVQSGPGARALLAVLLKPGARVQTLLNAPNGNADAALAYAADHGDAAMFEMLLEACQVSPLNDADQSLRRLALAAKVGSIAACKTLIEKAAVVLPKTAARRMNPLLQAVILQHHEVLAYLLKHGGHGCAKYKDTYKSAIEKALAMKDEKAVAIILAHDRHLSTELPPMMDHLMRMAIDNADVLSFEHLTKAMLGYERSSKKIRQCVENAIDIGCTAAVQMIIDPRFARTPAADEREDLFKRALCSTRLAPDIVLHFLQLEGHPLSGTGGTGGTDPYTTMLETGSSGAKRLVNTLIFAGAPKEQKVFWMASILCHSYLDTRFTAARDMSINSWGRLVAPLAKTMKGDAGFAAALSKAAAMAVMSGKSKGFCDILINVAARVLDVEIDLMPAAEAILLSKRLDLLGLLPYDIQQQLQAKYRTQLGAPYTH